MATFRKRNGKWQVQIRRAGLPAVSRTFLRKPDAVAWAAEKEHAANTADLKRVDHRQSHTLGDLLQRYEVERLPLKRSGCVERYVVGWFRRHPVASRQLRHLTSTDFAKLRDERLRDVTAATLRRQFTIIGHALKTAQTEWGWLVPYGEFRQVFLPPASIKIIQRVDDAKLGRLLAAAERQRNRLVPLAIRLAVETALRRGELLKLRWDEVDLTASTLVVREAKNGHPRTIPLTAAAVDLLRGADRTSDRVCPLTANCLKLAFQRARSRSGTSFRFHDLRHEAISRYFEVGLSIPEVQMISGHRTLSQLSRYSHADIRRVAEKLSAGEADKQSTA